MVHPIAYQHQNPMYRQPGSLGEPPGATMVTQNQCNSAYYLGAQTASQGLTAEQGLAMLPELFPETVTDPEQCLTGQCSLEELKSCYQQGYDEIKNPPAFYATTNGKMGLFWGALLGIAAGIGGTVAYQHYAPRLKAAAPKVNVSYEK